MLLACHSGVLLTTLSTGFCSVLLAQRVNIIASCRPCMVSLWGDLSQLLVAVLLAGTANGPLVPSAFPLPPDPSTQSSHHTLMLELAGTTRTFPLEGRYVIFVDNRLLSLSWQTLYAIFNQDDVSTTINYILIYRIWETVRFFAFTQNIHIIKNITWI